MERACKYIYIYIYMFNTEHTCSFVCFIRCKHAQMYKTKQNTHATIYLTVCEHVFEQHGTRIRMYVLRRSKHAIVCLKHTAHACKMDAKQKQTHTYGTRMQGCIYNECGTRMQICGQSKINRCMRAICSTYLYMFAPHAKMYVKTHICACRFLKFKMHSCMLFPI